MHKLSRSCVLELGGPTAAVIALHNPHVRVTVVDRDEGRINAWKGKHLPIHEPGLVEVVRLARDGCKEGVRRDSAQGQQNGVAALDGAVTSSLHSVDQPARLPNLFFSTACTQTIAEADMILISVNTPTKRRGVGAGRATDMTAIEGAVRDVATYARSGTILVEKSTVPCKTGQLIKDIVSNWKVTRPGA
jgi:UDPglucose 6-dehydrogenase